MHVMSYCNEAKQQILKVQNENRKTCNIRRITAAKYKINDLVTVKRTHFGRSFKLKKNTLDDIRYHIR